MYLRFALALSLGFIYFAASDCPEMPYCVKYRV
jgi:hypothetical protein